jgi:hypothetical protein
VGGGEFFLLEAFNEPGVVFRLEDAGFFFLDTVMYESSYVQRRVRDGDGDE